MQKWTWKMTEKWENVSYGRCKKIPGGALFHVSATSVSYTILCSLFICSNVDKTFVRKITKQLYSNVTLILYILCSLKMYPGLFSKKRKKKKPHTLKGKVPVSLRLHSHGSLHKPLWQSFIPELTWWKASEYPNDQSRPFVWTHWDRVIRNAYYRTAIAY